jgi:hypothetical protein
LQHPKILNSCGCVCVSIVNQSTISNSLSSKLGPNRKKLGTTPHTFGWFWLVYQHLSESVDCFRHTHTQTYLYPLSSLVGVIWMELEDRIGDKLSQTFGLFVLPGQELLLLFYCGLCLPLSLSLSFLHSTVCLSTEARRRVLRDCTFSLYWRGFPRNFLSHSSWRCWRRHKTHTHVRKCRFDTHIYIYMQK